MDLVATDSQDNSDEGLIQVHAEDQEDHDLLYRLLLDDIGQNFAGGLGNDDEAYMVDGDLVDEAEDDMSVEDLEDGDEDENREDNFPAENPDGEGHTDQTGSGGVGGPTVEEDDQELRDLFRNLGINLGNRYDPPGGINLSQIHHSVHYPGAARDYGPGETFTEKFRREREAHLGTSLESENLYYPLTSWKHWEFLNVLMRMRCSLAEKNELLDTQIVSAIF
jgi:hypothetical protein